eukprot:2872739-Amphidinium_carterae.1
MDLAATPQNQEEVAERESPEQEASVQIKLIHQKRWIKRLGIEMTDGLLFDVLILQNKVMKDVTKGK